MGLQGSDMTYRLNHQQQQQQKDRKDGEFNLTSETFKGLSQGTRRQKVTGAVRCVPRTLAAAKGRSDRWRPRGERAGRRGNTGHGDQAEFSHASELYDRLSGEKRRILEEGLQRWKQHRANSQRSTVSFSKMQRTTMSGSLATGRSQH